MIDKRYSAREKREVWFYDFWLRILGRRKRFRAGGFRTKADAARAVELITARAYEINLGKAAPVSRPKLADLAAHRINQAVTRAERTRTARVLRDLLSLFPDGVLVDEMTTPGIRLYVEFRQRAGQSAASINRELNIVAATLNSAADWYPELAQWRPPKMPRPKVSKSRRERIITDDEYRRVMEQLRRPPDEDDAKRRQNQAQAYRARLRVAQIFEFALNTGMRPSEIYRLPWSSIDWDGDRIRVDTTKTDAVRYVPLSVPARAILRDLQAEHGGRYYVFTKGGQPTPNLYRLLRVACERAGIAYGRKVRDGFELYCSRHTFATRLLQAGADLRTVGDVTGHTDRQMVLHYSHVTPESTERARAAIEAIQRRREGQDVEEIGEAELAVWLDRNMAAGEILVIPPRWHAALRRLLAKKEIPEQGTPAPGKSQDAN